MVNAFNTKIFCAILLALTVMIVFSYAILTFVVAPRFEELDRASALGNSSRVRNALSSELAELARTARDWAEWDDTYQFVVGQKPDFIENNLYPKAVSDLNVNVFSFFDQNMEQVWGLAGSEGPGGAFAYAQPRPSAATMGSGRPEPVPSATTLSGLTMTTQGPMLFASTPVLTSRSDGPPHGHLVVGRLLDRTEIAMLEQRASAPIEIWQIGGAMPPVEAAFLQHPPEDFSATRVSAEENKLYAAYIMPDVAGLPAIVISTSIEKQASKIGEKTIGLAMSCLIAVALAVVLALLALVYLVLLRPLTQLEGHIIRVGKTGDLEPFDDSKRQDPIGRLAREFNGMIRALANLRQKEAEQSLAYKVAMEASEAANIAKSSFVAHMSHELRTPLNAIIGFSEMMASELMGPIGSTTYRDYARDIHLSGRHLLALVDDILDLSVAETGGLHRAEVPIDLRSMIEECCRIQAPEAQHHGVLLTSCVEHALHIVADPRLCRQMVLNLLSNGIKFSPHGGTVAIAGIRDEAGRTLISISDCGVGMAAEEIPLALEAFSQVTKNPMIKARGVGLGLPLTKRFMEEHGGTLDVQSRMGEGTTVTLNFPAERHLSPEDLAAAP